jgi:hypothetical protein
MRNKSLDPHMRSYRYLGPSKERQEALRAPRGRPIETAEDLAAWVTDPEREAGPEGSVTATFVVDVRGRLLLAPRRSEHVACAGAADVLSAGEMTFSVEGDAIAVTDVSNQSAGYCPEPESWPAVEACLARIGAPHPGRFTREIHFRLCPSCGQKNLVKERDFRCGSCGFDLPRQWNFDPPGAGAPQGRYELWEGVAALEEDPGPVAPVPLSEARERVARKIEESREAVLCTIRGNLSLDADDSPRGFDGPHGLGESLALALRDACIHEVWALLKDLLDRLGESERSSEEAREKALSEFSRLLRERVFVRGAGHKNEGYLLEAIRDAVRILRGVLSHLMPRPRPP